MWIVTILASAFLDSLKPLFGKKGSLKLNADLIGFSQWFFALVLLLPLLVILDTPDTDAYFWFIVMLSAILNAIATVLYWRGILLSDLSLALPIASLTPLFLLITSPLITHESPSIVGALGLVIAVLGAYVLNLSRRAEGFWRPLSAIVEEKGIRLVLLVAVIWSITSNLDKVAISHSSPLFYITILHVLVAMLLFPFLLKGKRLKELWNVKTLLPVGIFSGGSLALQMYAYTGTIVPYVLGVKRVSVLFGILWGALFFREQQVKERFVGGLIMVFGVVLIILFG